MSKGNLCVGAGGSGVVKSTGLKLVIDEREDLKFSVSATTRPPRPGEEHGVNYFFMNRDQFRELIQRGEFMEYDAHMDNLYGTPRGQLEEKLRNYNVILDVEPNGAFAVRAERPDATLIFVAPPSMEELEHRLRSRGDTDEAQIQLRLKRAIWEMSQRFQYDYIVINDKADACADEILHIIAEKAD